LQKKYPTIQYEERPNDHERGRERRVFLY